MLNEKRINRDATVKSWEDDFVLAMYGSYLTFRETHQGDKLCKFENITFSDYILALEFGLKYPNEVRQFMEDYKAKFPV